ncbi:HesA/MoeB/ThiF family protein [Sedimentibacter sp.]|nr:HesA/MoeB/ThiF family protein [Sedimentibacter sp.]
MPEISMQGQKKLIESTVLVYGESTKDIMITVLYLSAIGIGKIFCYLKDDSEYESLFCDAKDLNNDVSIEIVNEYFPADKADVRIILGSISFIDNIINKNGFIPTIVSMVNEWKGTLQTFIEVDNLNEYAQFTGSKQYFNKEKNLLTASFSGVLCSVECVKLILNIGKTHKNLLIFDLLLMEFNTFNQAQYESVIYNFNIENNISLSKKEIIKKLNNSRVLVVGTGGLGSPSALGLAIAGVGTIGLLDSDKVELSNLNRQILHSVSRIGIPKAESAKFFVSNINHNINVITHVSELNSENAEDTIREYDAIISAVDNIQTRYIINDTSYLLKKPVVEAGVLRFDGTNTTIIPDEGHCYRCLYPNVNTSGMTCSEAGILGSIPGVMGFIEAIELVKVIANIGVTLKNKILLFDGLEMEFNVISLSKNPECPVCGNHYDI